MLSLGITFLGMYFLKRLLDGLNFREYFAYFQKYLWRMATVQRWFKGTQQWSGGPTAVEGNQR